jgi:predicted N-formylglutamate amidohydrolase
MASNDFAPPLLAAADASPVTIVNPGGRSPFLLIGDHAGNVIPSSLGTLGLSDSDRQRHIAWDIGVAEVGTILSRTLDAPFIRQRYSRLVVDCNRAPGAPDAIASVSDGTVIPGNRELTAGEAEQRYALIHEPYQQAIGAALAARDAEQRDTILIALHSFTPHLGGGERRPWQIGILHDAGDASFAMAMLEALRRDDRLTVGDNEPYRMDRIDYTVPRHAYPRRRRYAEVEMRQDLIASAEGQLAWAARLAAVLTALIDQDGTTSGRGLGGAR